MQASQCSCFEEEQPRVGDERVMRLGKEDDGLNRWDWIGLHCVVLCAATRLARSTKTHAHTLSMATSWIPSALIGRWTMCVSKQHL